MTKTFDEFINAVNAIDNDFSERVRQLILPRAIRQNLRLCSTNLVVEIDSNGAYTPHGCPTCLGVLPKQTEDGTPMLSDTKCLDAWTIGLTDSHLPPEVMLNMWFCPNCKIPLMQLVPQFE